MVYGLCNYRFIKGVQKLLYINWISSYCVYVRELLAPYSATSRELSGAAKASLRLGLGHPLATPYILLGLAASFLPHRFVSLSPVLGYCPTHYHIVLFHRLPM